MERIKNRFELLRLELKDVIVERRLTTNLLKETLLTCVDPTEKQFIQEDILDNEAIIADSKLEREELDQLDWLLQNANIKEIISENMHKKMTLPASKESISNKTSIAKDKH